VARVKLHAEHGVPSIQKSFVVLIVDEIKQWQLCITASARSTDLHIQFWGTLFELISLKLF